MISGLLLAAGAGRRFGGQKLLESVGTMPLVCATLRTCLDSRLDEIVVVTGVDTAVSDAVRSRFPDEARLAYTTNIDPGRGLMSSIKVGLRALSPRTSAVMIIHADMPLVPSRAIDQLVLEHSWHGGIVIPVCGDREVHPRVIPRSLFDEFLDLADDACGTDVIDRYRADVTRVPFDDVRKFMDIDVPADIDAWRDADAASR